MSNKMAKLDIRVPVDVRSKLDEIAENKSIETSMDIKRSDIVRAAIKQYIERYDADLLKKDIIEEIIEDGKEK